MSENNSIRNMRTHRTVFTTLLLFVLAATGNQASAVSVVYDWSTAAASAGGVLATGNNGWAKTGGEGDGTGDTVRSAGQPDGNFTGNYYQSVLDGSPGGGGTGDSVYARANNGSFSYAIPASATSISFSFITRHSGDIAAVTDIGVGGLLSGLTSVINFGNGANGWNYRDVGDANSQASNGSIAATTLDGSVNTWRLTGTLDMTPVGTQKTLDLLVENLSLGGSELIFDDAAFELGAFADPSLWDGLVIRTNGISDPASMDALTVSFSAVPIPAALWLFGSGLLGLFGIARTKKR